MIQVSFNHKYNNINNWNGADVMLKFAYTQTLKYCMFTARFFIRSTSSVLDLNCFKKKEIAIYFLKISISYFSGNICHGILTSNDLQAA